ncbi:MAG: hypothetical protein C4563_02445 [Desulfobulbus sp.]|nr:MAG: hypothetical protein C4563_02445 [Desulfobulbus sp.]
MATRFYCANVAGELEILSEKLHNLSEKIDRIPSIDKFKLQPHIDELHMIMTELDDRLCEMVISCDTVDMLDRREESATSGVSFNEPVRRNELFDYDIGG